jgi:hypothetical protein
MHRAAGEGHRLLDRLLRGDHCCKVAYPKSLDSLSLGEPDPTVDHDLLAQALSPSPSRRDRGRSERSAYQKPTVSISSPSF